ncbi:hypothetical protein BEI_0909 [Halomonas beimenensis]|uniref:Uncharacterized protein n=1 Tax=Halomonas beimenensis TaxID=475662 RepID=A0A291P4T3_9GAMM|nr:hypothetical protein BEI_0909 [Halomonas beimenensis]
MLHADGEGGPRAPCVRGGRTVYQGPPGFAAPHPKPARRNPSR